MHGPKFTRLDPILTLLTHWIPQQPYEGRTIVQPLDVWGN